MNMEVFYFTLGLVFQALPLRVLDSSATFVIAVAMLCGLAMCQGLKERRAGMMFVAPFLLMVVVLDHCTVWVVTLAGLGAIWWLAGRTRRSNKAGLLVPVGIGALVLAALFVLAPQSRVSRVRTAHPTGSPN